MPSLIISRPLLIFSSLVSSLWSYLIVEHTPTGICLAPIARSQQAHCHVFVRI